jgi:hypothetical protein
MHTSNHGVRLTMKGRILSWAVVGYFTTPSSRR